MVLRADLTMLTIHELNVQLLRVPGVQCTTSDVVVGVVALTPVGAFAATVHTTHIQYTCNG